MIWSISAYSALLPKLKPLHDNWRVKASIDFAGLQPTGETLSRPGYAVEGWYPATVPATVMGVLIQNRVYPDPFVGRNLEKISRDPFLSSWWFRTEFDWKAAGDDFPELVLDGINYRADVWINGRLLAAKENCFGAFRVFRIPLKGVLVTGENTVAIEVFPPKPGDFTLGFVDWNPIPPDRNMGIWREVRIESSGPVSLRHPFVSSAFNEGDLRQADLEVEAEICNQTDHVQNIEIRGAIGPVTFSRNESLGKNERKTIRFKPAEYPQLRIHNPRLWWPHDLGKPELYNLDIEVVSSAGMIRSDRRSIRFGIREVRDFINADGHRGYMVNGRKILIRGGGWVDDLFLIEDEKKLEAQIRYSRHMNLNTIRLEGFWGSSQKFYDLADEYGILLMAGWSCQWEWAEYLGKPVDENFGGVLSDDDMILVSDYWRDQVLWLRHHPSIFVWVLGSDLLPTPVMERRYREMQKNLDLSRPLLASCKSHNSSISGPTAVKMNGPYEYVTPNYWYLDRQNGGAFGFNTETGPGPQPPVLESIKRMITPGHLWPIDEEWEFHCARNEFGSLKRYMDALEPRYGKPGGVEAFARMAQAANYEAIRGMFEAFRVNKFRSTGVIQWMLNASWPKLWWQLYDYYLVPTGAFYGTRAACSPLQAVYHYGEDAVYLVNDGTSPGKHLQLDITILDADSRIRFKKVLPVSVSSEKAERVFTLADAGITGFRFLDLKLKDGGGRPVAVNFYWLPELPDQLDFPATTWFYTPVKEYADLTVLNRLPPASVETTASWSKKGEDGHTLNLTLMNKGKTVAFFLELQAVHASQSEILTPVFWEDNFISLLPGEKRIIPVRFGSGEISEKDLRVRISGWNVKRVECRPSGVD